jgi:hypothetical protein
MLKNLEVQLKRTKGYRMPQGCVKVARPTLFGNPFGTANEYRLWLTTDWEPKNRSSYFADGWGWSKFSTMDKDGILCWNYEKLRSRKQIILLNIPLLRGKPIACFCQLGTNCHRKVLIELANK